MKKKRIKQKEDKKTDRKHGNRTRKAILGILSVLVLLCLNSCGRELEEREFPDTLVIRDSALPFEKSLQTEQDKSSKYLDYGQVRCILLEDDLAEDDEKLGEVLLALEKRPAFSRNIYFFTADGKVLEQREKQKEESQDLTGFYQKSTDHKREAATLGSLLYRLHNGSGEHKILKLKEEDGKLVPQNYLNVLKKTENENTAKKTKTNNPWNRETDNKRDSRSDPTGDRKGNPAFSCAGKQRQRRRPETETGSQRPAGRLYERHSGRSRRC